jgi:DHA2 family multidrug resistance protein
MIAGVLAVLAPTVGPVVGGWITETYSWPWLFLINVPPGIIAASMAAISLPKERPSFDQVRHLDVASLGLVAVALATLGLQSKGPSEAGRRLWLPASRPVPMTATAFVGRTRDRKPACRPAHFS